jgi:hypothetical protein
MVIAVASEQDAGGRHCFKPDINARIARELHGRLPGPFVLTRVNRSAHKE